MNTADLKSELLQAGLIAARDLTASLKEKAANQGWPSEAANGLSVSFSDTGFSIDIAPEVSDLVAKLEYGTETLEPNPVIRTFSLRSHTLGNSLASTFGQKLGLDL